MKTKKFSKKLELNKETIASLNSKQLTDVKAGGPNVSYGITTCTVCNTYMCPPATIELTECLTTCCITIWD